MVDAERLVVAVVKEGQARFQSARTEIDKFCSVTIFLSGSSTVSLAVASEDELFNRQ